MHDRTYTALALLLLSAWSWLTPWAWSLDAVALGGMIALAYFIGTPEP